MHVSYIFTEILAQAKPTNDQIETGFGYVIAAFIVIWLFIAGYLFWLHRRQESLRQEVNILRQETLERHETSAVERENKPEEKSSAGAGRTELGG